MDSHRAMRTRVLYQPSRRALSAASTSSGSGLVGGSASASAGRLPPPRVRGLRAWIWSTSRPTVATASSTLSPHAMRMHVPPSGTLISTSGSNTIESTSLVSLNTSIISPALISTSPSSYSRGRSSSRSDACGVSSALVHTTLKCAITSATTCGEYISSLSLAAPELAMVASHALSSSRAATLVESRSSYVPLSAVGWPRLRRTHARVARVSTVHSTQGLQGSSSGSSSGARTWCAQSSCPCTK